MNKRGQMAIFIIIALVIVAAVLAVLMYPQIKSVIAPTPLSPTVYLESCIQSDVNAAVKMLSEQGGYANPEGFIKYEGKNVKYLCYTTGYYKTCIVQQPLLISHFSSELSKILTPKAESCLRSLKSNFEKEGFTVTLSDVKSEVSLSLDNVEINFNSPMVIKKEASTQTFDKFSVRVPSQIYTLLSIASSIVDFEATYGDSETTAYTQYYPDLMINKIKLEDGVKIYKLGDVITKESFTFATRSLVWPAGFGL